MPGGGLYFVPDFEQLGGGADPPVGELGQTHRSHCGQISVLAPKDVTDSCAATILRRKKERSFKRGVKGGRGRYSEDRGSSSERNSRAAAWTGTGGGLGGVGVNIPLWYVLTIIPQCPRQCLSCAARTRAYRCPRAQRMGVRLPGWRRGTVRHY